MTKFPSKRAKVYIEDIEREIVLRELTIGYIKNSQVDEEFDTPESALLMCGVTAEEIDKIGTSVASELYKAIVQLTYPDLDMSKKAEKTEDELKDSKKN